MKTFGFRNLFANPNIIDVAHDVKCQFTGVGVQPPITDRQSVKQVVQGSPDAWKRACPVVTGAGSEESLLPNQHQQRVWATRKSSNQANS